MNCWILLLLLCGCGNGGSLGWNCGCERRDCDCGCGCERRDCDCGCGCEHRDNDCGCGQVRDCERDGRRAAKAVREAREAVWEAREAVRDAKDSCCDNPGMVPPPPRADFNYRHDDDCGCQK